MLQAPPRSPYDLNFDFLGYPVRVHWGFWVMAAILGWGWSNYVNSLSLRMGEQLQVVQAEWDGDGDGGISRDELGEQGWSSLSEADTDANDRISWEELRSFYSMDSPGAPVLLAIWVAAVFLSVLVHELGHAVAFRYYGIESHIVLYHFGGLAIPASFGSWNAARRPQIGAFEQIVISAAGPVAQLALAAVTIAIGYVAGVRLDLDVFNWILVTDRFPSSGATYALLNGLLFPSIFWALINLLPILPLDGGQIMRHALALYRVAQPLRMAYMISIAVGLLCGLYFISKGDSFAGIMFLVFAANNWQSMQYSGSGF